ncbi:MAG: Threonine synthase [Bacteroidetes bacterium ADurb.Bin408]|nr:MAG: Threonine synthase [Bacteroidetes bacterium ADurb.Bin408]
MFPPILYYSTNLKAPRVTFREALLKGLAPDRGLYMPELIPPLSMPEIDAFSALSYDEIALRVMQKFLSTELPGDIFATLVKDAYNFDVPLEKVVDRKYIMRLDQGPTASFKDFAARMMGRLINYYLGIENRQLIILTATSGDTGSAIANAFFGLNNIKVVVLFPETEVTLRQRKQMTTLGKNILIVAIDGKFDDCQALVKQAFSDHELEFLNLSSANSINIGRLIPQIVYYFYAFAKLRNGNSGDDITFSVPSGNFGDMMGGVLAMKMGLPVRKFIIATNANDEFPVLLKTQKYDKIEPSRNCISSAMNVGHPSNLARLIALYGGVMDEKGNISKQPDYTLMNKDIHGVSISDNLTRDTIRYVYDKYKVILEPHGAVGWAGLNDYLNTYPAEDNPDALFVSLETAHPAKFPVEINNILGIDPELPESLKGIEHKHEYIIKVNNNYPAFKEFLKYSF